MFKHTVRGNWGWKHFICSLYFRYGTVRALALLAHYHYNGLEERPGQCLICQPLCNPFSLLTYWHARHHRLGLILLSLAQPFHIRYFTFTRAWHSYRSCIEQGPGSGKRQRLCRGPFSIQLSPHSQDSGLCRDITVLEAFNILQKTQHWVREQARGGKYIDGER